MTPGSGAVVGLTPELVKRFEAAARHPSLAALQARTPPSLGVLISNVLFVAFLAWLFGRAHAWRLSVEGSAARTEWGLFFQLFLGGAALFTIWRIGKLVVAKTRGLPMIVLPNDGAALSSSLVVIDAMGTTRKFASAKRPSREVGELLFVWFRADVLLDVVSMDEPPSDPS